MKQMKKMSKLNYAAGLLVFCILLGVTSRVNAKDTNAGSPVAVSEGVCSVLYQDITAYRKADSENGTFTKSPALEGYVFAGWYTSSDLTAENSLSPDVTSADTEACKNVYAKFVSQDVLSARAQLLEGTDSLSALTTMRFVTTVDSLDYETVGFELVLKDVTYVGETNTVARKLKALSGGQEMELVPSEEFHAASQYFMACNLRDIPAAYFEDAVSVTPYWVTLDGTKVYGVSSAKIVKTDGMPTVCDALVTNAAGNVSYYATLEKCFSQADGSNQYLADQDTVTIIQENISLTQTLQVYSSVTLTNQADKNVVVKRSEDASTDDLTVMIDNYGTGLVVKGNTTGSLSFDGEEKEYGYRFLNNNKTATLQNILVQGFVTTGRGGALFQANVSTASLKISGCTFINNSATQHGGVVHVTTGSMTVESSTFSQNQSGSYGGAVSVNNGSVKINKSCSFTENEALYGGAFYAYKGTTTIDNCDFASNSASQHGGALYVGNGGDAKKVILQNGCTFRNNQVQAEENGHGGAVYVAGRTLEDTGSVYKGNTASANGGSIYVAGGNLIEKSASFTGNQAVSGGAIYANAGASVSSACLFQENEATGNGGAVCVNNGSLEDTGSTFTGNIGNHGGAMRVEAKAVVTITDSIFNGNTTRTTAKYNGGAINNLSESLTITNTAFTDNYAKNQGGAIRSTKTMTVTGCVFDKNSSKGSGAAATYEVTDATTTTFVNTTLIDQDSSAFENISLVTQTTQSSENGGIENISDCGDDYQMSLLTDVTEEDFEAYCKRFAANGCKLYAENEINGNLFRTYSLDGEWMVHTYWVKYSKEVRTIVAKTTLLPVTSSSTSTTKQAATLYQLEALNSSSSDGGMGYIIQLSDGRYIVIDGGHYTDTNAKAIYQYLVEHASNTKKITIAAWYITHTHSDHSGALRYFTEHVSEYNTAYKAANGTLPSITIETVLLNACDTDEQLENCKEGAGDEKTSVESDLKKYFPAAKIYKPLTGQVYTFANTSIEILYTMSDFLPSVIAQEKDGNGGDYNVQSVVSMIDIDNTGDKNDKFFVMGDTNATASEEMCARYEDYLESDYVQVAHHGLNEIVDGKSHNSRRHGPVKAIYDYAMKDDKSTIALWPTSQAKFEERSEAAGLVEVNIYLRTLVKDENNIVAGNGGTLFTFK